jgi:hypothetical protein
MNNRTRRKSPTVNAAATAAYAAFLSALRAKPNNPATLDEARAHLAAVITAEAATGAPGTGFEVSMGVNNRGEHITETGMKPGTPFALIMRQEGKRAYLGKAWPCGALDSAGPACFSV